MTSSHNKIIRGADIDGVVFCTPSGDLDKENPLERQERDNLKTLEEFWRNKGFQEGKEAGFEQGWKEGKSEGYRKGLQEGEAKGREEGKSEGYQKGLKEGEEKVRSELQESIFIMNKGVEQLQEQQKILYEDAKPELVRFALTVCEKVLRRQLEDSDALMTMVNAIFQQARPIMKDVVVDVIFSSEDLAMVEEALRSVTVNEAKKINFVADESLQRGDIRVETPLGLVNFNLERILCDLEKKTLEVRSETTEE